MSHGAKLEFYRIGLLHLHFDQLPGNGLLEYEDHSLSLHNLAPEFMYFHFLLEVSQIQKRTANLRFKLGILNSIKLLSIMVFNPPYYKMGLIDIFMSLHHNNETL